MFFAGLRIGIPGGRGDAPSPWGERSRGARRAAGSAAPVLLLWAVACSLPGADRAAGPARVALLAPPSERPIWAEIARSFERSRPGVLVDVVEGPQATDLRENLYTASLLAGDDSFDLVYMDVTWNSKFAGSGWLLPLEERFAVEERDRLLPAAVAAGWYAGHLYRMPVRTDVGLLYWRRDLIEGAGRSPPRTFDELAEIARSLQSPPERWGFVWQGKQYEGLVCGFLEVLHGHGGFWIDPMSGEVGLDRREAIRALEFLQGCVIEDRITPPGVTTYQEEESRRLFQDGRAVFLRNWPYVWRLAQADGSPVRGRIGAGPMVHAAGGRPAATLGGWGFGISRHSRNADLAEEFIRFAVSLEGQRRLCLESGYAPARIEAYTDAEFLEANPFLAEIERAHRYAIPRPAIPRYALVSDILQRHLSAALSGAERPEEALREAARETRRLLGSTPGHGRAPDASSAVEERG